MDPSAQIEPQMTAAGRDNLVRDPELEPPSQAAPDPQTLCEIVNVYYFTLLNCGIISEQQ